MSYFTRNGIKDSKPHQYIEDGRDHNGRGSVRAFEKRANRRFVRRASKAMITLDNEVEAI